MKESNEKMIGSIEKTGVVIGKAQLIVKRVILGILIFILLVITLFETIIMKQTIIAKDYIKTTATYSGVKEKSDDSIFDDYLYTFVDKNDVKQEIVVSLSEDSTPSDTIVIKYNENNYQEYYMDGEFFDKMGVIWYIVKVITIILLIILFFNKKLLSKINMSFGR